MNIGQHLPSGLWVILATAFTPSDAVDHVSMTRQVRLARSAGADGGVALGVFGEAAHLSLAEQHAVASTTARALDGLPLVLGVAGRSTSVAVEQGENALAGAVSGGAIAASVRLMVQINTPVTEDLVAHLTAVHEATGVSIVLQDYPAISGVRIGPDALLDVLAACPFVAAVKAEAPPTPVAIGSLTGRTDVPVFGGLGGVGLIDELAMGAAGAMTGFSHPEGLRATLDAYRLGGFDAARAAWAPWLPLANFEAQASIQLALRKLLLHRRGVLDHAAARPPAPPVPDAVIPLVNEHMAAADGLITSGHGMTRPVATDAEGAG